jgi:hypothetical protein
MYPRWLRFVFRSLSEPAVAGRAIPPKRFETIMSSTLNLPIRVEVHRPLRVPLACPGLRHKNMPLPGGKLGLGAGVTAKWENRHVDVMGNPSDLGKHQAT